MPSETLFPHLYATGPAPSYREVLSTYRTVFRARVAEGSLRPLVIPYLMYGYILLGVYLCIPHTNSRVVYAARWPVLALILLFEWKKLWETSSENAAFAVVAGISTAWIVVVSVIWLVLYRPQFDAKRVQRKSTDPPRKYGIDTNGPERIDGETGSGTNDLRERKKGTIEPYVNGSSKENGAVRPRIGNGVSGKIPEEEHVKYHWQSYPDTGTFGERAAWVSDLLLNFRGPGWNWAIPPLPDLPDHIKLKLGEPLEQSPVRKRSSGGLRLYTTRTELFYGTVPRFLMFICLLDLFKTIMMKDPYFSFGPTTYALPPHLANLSFLSLRMFRMTMTAVAVCTSLETAFLVVPIVAGVMCGPRVFGQRAEPWYFASDWGSFSTIANKGLNGLWGSWWHQTFRFAFAAPTDYLINNNYIKPRSITAKISGLFFAFGVSGFLHALGSITQLPKTHISHPPIYFLLQGLGIIIQTTLCSIFRPQIDKIPKWVRQAGNIMFTWSWLFLTSSWLADDFARGGVWLWEPLPISPLRGLGFGIEGDGFWTWDTSPIRWYTGKHWWESGLAI